MGDICGDNRFHVIKKAKELLVEQTNIESNLSEMAVIDNILFRCWQMGMGTRKQLWLSIVSVTSKRYRVLAWPVRGGYR